MRISDWSSDVCSSDLMEADRDDRRGQGRIMEALERVVPPRGQTPERGSAEEEEDIGAKQDAARPDGRDECEGGAPKQRAGLRLRHGGRLGCNHFHFNLRLFAMMRSEEHTYELQSLMRLSYAVFCWKNKNTP